MSRCPLHSPPPFSKSSIMYISPSPHLISLTITHFLSLLVSIPLIIQFSKQIKTLLCPPSSRFSNIEWSVSSTQTVSLLYCTLFYVHYHHWRAKPGLLVVPVVVVLVVFPSRSSLDPESPYRVGGGVATSRISAWGVPPDPKRYWYL